MILRVHHAGLPRRGERVSGDAAVVRQADGRALVALVDGLGHGEEAAAAAWAARRALEARPLDDDIAGLFDDLHRALQGTRGAALTACLLHAGRLRGAAVGNVELRADGSSVPAVLSPGILGVSVRKVRCFEATLAAGTRLVLFSDGISSHLVVESLRGLAPPEACARVLRDHRLAHDDATVLVADLEGT